MVKRYNWRPKFSGDFQDDGDSEDHDDHPWRPEGEGTEENIDAHYYGSQEWQETK